MINVLQVITELGDGGVEMMLINLYKEIDKSKVKFIFCVQSDKRNREQQILNLGGEIIQIEPLSEIGTIKYMKKIYNICKEYDISCVHCHNLLQNIFILFAAKLAGVKKRISHSHLTTIHRKKLLFLLPLFRQIISMLATNRLACGLDAGKFLYGKKDFIIINNAIDIDKFTNYKNDYEIKKINEKYGNNIILHVGRLSTQKNHIYIIEIAKHLKNENINFTILCCGDGPEKNKLTELINKNNLDDCIKLLGSIENLVPYYYAAKVMLLPSLYEGLPVVSIEMQAAGLEGIFSNTIDRTCDLGLNLIHFVGISQSNVSEWIDEIKNILNKDIKSNRENIAKALNCKGYNVNINAKKLLDIYIGE